MFREPKAAKKLHFDVIPRTLTEGRPVPRRQDDRVDDDQLSNPTDIHGGEPPRKQMPATFSMLMNLCLGLQRRSRGAVGFLLPPPT